MKNSTAITIPTIRRFPEYTLSVVGQAADVLISLFFLKELGKGGLDEGGDYAKEGRHPHPEQRARAAGGDGSCNAHDVTCAHPHGCTQHEGGHGADTGVLLCLLLEQNLDAPGKEAELNKSRADAEVDSDAHQQEHGGA